MLAKWTEILPLFVIRWLALKYCEAVPMQRENHSRMVVTARPDIYIKIEKRKLYNYQY